MTKKRVNPMTVTQLASLGGKAASAKLSPDERSARAKKAALALRDGSSPAERSDRARKAALFRWMKTRTENPNV